MVKSPQQVSEWNGAANTHLYGVRMLRGGGLSQRWYISITEFRMEFLETTCWSWIVELLKAFLMLMSCRETEKHNQKQMIQAAEADDEFLHITSKEMYKCFKSETFLSNKPANLCLLKSGGRGGS